MFQRILVPLDGSERAEQAIPLAARLARASGGSLFFARVIDTMREIRVYSSWTTAYLQEMEEQEQAEAVEYLTVKKNTCECAGIQVHSIVIAGPIPSTLLKIVERERIDLVVMCSHGYSGFKRWVLGSVAQKIVRQSPVPVFLLRAQHMELKGNKIRAIVALDGSPFSETALVPTASLVASLSSVGEGEIELLTVAQMPSEREKRECLQRGIDVDLREATLRVAKETLRAAKEKLLQTLPEKSLVKITQSVVESGDTAHALIKAAEEGNESGIQRPYDILALTTHGRGGIQRWTLGSVTERVLQGSTLPLFIVHALQTQPDMEEPTPPVELMRS